MKKNFTLPAVMIAVVLLAFTANATKWRVNNTGVTGNFTTIQLAHNAASAGDTIYLESSRLSYGAFTCSKRLVIIGAGYFLDENDSTQANIAGSIIDDLFFSAGSENSIIMGVLVNGHIFCQADRVLIKRVYMKIGDMNIAANNVVVTQCYINRIVSAAGGNFTLTNSVVFYKEVSGYCIQLYGTSTGTIRNNIICGAQWLNSDEYTNNISTGTTGQATEFGGTNLTVSNNIGAANQYAAYNDSNQVYVNMATVFVNTGSTDGKYKLAPGSPAIHWGHNKVDCGIYGGPTPYIPSGMPTVPAIWYMQVNGTNVSVKAKSH
ncbi:MAG: hypothetical protein WCK09_16990 [Bacteroidota bacterium]